MINSKLKTQNSKLQFKIQKCFIIFNFVLLFCILIFGFWIYSYAQELTEQALPSETKQEAVQPQAETKTEEQTAVVETLAKSQNVTLDFKEADIRNVLKIISYKSGVNIVTTPEVMGNVTIRLVDVPWDKALDVILRTYGFGYERVGNIITVAPIDKLTAQKKQEAELAQVQPTITEVFVLAFLDAIDAKKALESLLSTRGKITVLEMSGQAGWEFGGVELAKRKRRPEEKTVRSKTLIISDVPPVLDKIREVIAQIDSKPQQIAIETRIMEVNHDLLKDIGFDWGVGKEGAESSTISITPTQKGPSGTVTGIGGHILGSQVSPAIFNPEQTNIGGTEPFNTGLQLVFQKLTGTQFEAILHALEEDVRTNTLSAPRIMALNNQEASILVGTKYPILKSEESTQTTTTVTKSLDYYQDIGIQLNVVPQISGKDYINMVIHPAVTSTSTGVGDTKTVYYPIITTREAETRVIMKDGETVVIGGLLKDVKSTNTMGIPFLKDIPLLGVLFRRDTEDIEKIDLLVFITAHIVKDEEFSAEAIAKLEENLGKDPQAIIKKKRKK